MIDAQASTPAITRSIACLAIVPSPIGELRLVATDLGLCGIFFPDHHGAAIAPAREAPAHPVLRVAATQLREYFAGTRVGFTIPLAPAGTAFQHRVWGALATIPFGQTRTYAQLARAIGAPTATRAVGAANAKNPISIVVPCHRVIGADGKLTGFAGGLDAKRWLLAHERRGPNPA